MHPNIWGQKFYKINPCLETKNKNNLMLKSRGNYKTLTVEQ